MKTFSQFVQDCNLIEGKIPWDEPQRSGWSARHKNRAKRISLGVENPDNTPSEKDLERYGALLNAHRTQSNIKRNKKIEHKNIEDYADKWDPHRRLPSHNIHGEHDGLRRQPRNYSRGEDRYKRKYGAAKDEQRDKYYKKGPKGLKEPK